MFIDSWLITANNSNKRVQNRTPELPTLPLYQLAPTNLWEPLCVYLYSVLSLEHAALARDCIIRLADTQVAPNMCNRCVPAKIYFISIFLKRNWNAQSIKDNRKQKIDLSYYAKRIYIFFNSVLWIC